MRSHNPGGPFDIRVVRIELTQAVNVNITNSSEAPLCVRAEALSNDSHEMDLWLRDNRGSAIKDRQPGFLLPPKEGAVKIAPNETVSGTYQLAGRFLLPKRQQNGLQIKAAFHYGDCHGPETLLAVSTWQPI
jgi:hypothetical protein